MVTLLVTCLNYIHSLFGDEKGVTALEYGLIAGLIAVVIIVAVTQVGSDLNNVFHNVAQNLNSVG